MYAWEVAWWGLDDDANDVTYTDRPGDDVRIYGMKNFAGLEYDRDGDGTYRKQRQRLLWLPVADSRPPGPFAEYVVLAQRVRTNFKAQNLELNSSASRSATWRAAAATAAATGATAAMPPVATATLAAARSSAARRRSRCTGRAACGTSARMTTSCTPPSSLVAGGTPDSRGFDGWSYDDDNELYYDMQVENHLVGPQLGWTMNYCYACQWNFFCNSTFGVFNNHIEHDQRMWSRRRRHGAVQRRSGDEFDVESDKDDISFLGELRLGGSYDITCNWRASRPTARWPCRRRDVDRPDPERLHQPRVGGDHRLGQLDDRARRAGRCGVPVLTKLLAISS